MPTRDLILISDVDWASPYLLPIHHVSKRLAAHYRVFFIDNFGGVRPLRMSDAGRALGKLRRAWSGPRSSPADDGDVVVHQPFIVPSPRPATLLGPLNGWLLGRALRRLVQRHEVHDPILWTRVPSEVVWRALERVPHSLLVYQAVDRFPFSPTIAKRDRPRLAGYERHFAASADLVFASARGLYDEKLTLNTNTHFFPNGVDAEPFRSASGPHPMVSQLPRPIVGFVGNLGPWVDYDLIRRAAELTPEFSYALAGPASPGIELAALRNLPNVHLLGGVPHSELPALLASFDVGLIPYTLDEFTAFTFPSKLAEYLAAGLPIVSTRLPELAAYNDVVELVDGPDALAEALRVAVTGDAEAAARREVVARLLEWDTIVDGMMELLDARLGERP